MKKEFIKKIIIFGTTTLIIGNMYCTPASAKWINDSKNNWNWIEGEAKATGWKKINKEWYYFNKDGIMSTGWLKYNEKWYNLSNDGVMNTGWKKINEKWYNFNSDGVMNIGWINDKGTWYFTNSTGQMETGTIGIDGKVYTFSDSGAMINNKETTQKIQSESEDVKSVKTEENNKDGGNDKSDSNTRIAYVSTSSDPLNVRSESKISSVIIGTIAKNAEVKVIGDEENGFYPILINNKKGWGSSKWISFEKPKDSNSSANTNTNSNANTNTNTNTNTNSNTNSNSNYYVDIKDDSLDNDVIRNTEPSLDDKHYYSDNNPYYKIGFSPLSSNSGSSIKGNCTWYAWGRAWEITGSKPDDAGFVGNAYEWWAANKKSGKYEYGSEPRAGAIAVWKSNLPNSDGSGHVAVVEKIEDGKIYISESMWHGAAFTYREIYETSYLYGYIYLDKPNY